MESSGAIFLLSHDLPITLWQLDPFQGSPVTKKKVLVEYLYFKLLKLTAKGNTVY